MSCVCRFLVCVIGAALLAGASATEGTAAASPAKSATALPEDPQELVRLLMRKPSLIGPLLDMEFLDLLAAAQGPVIGQGKMRCGDSKSALVPPTRRR